MKQVCRLFLLVMVTAAGLSAGCTSSRPLQIEPISKKASVIAPTFPESYYFYDRDQTIFFVMRSYSTDKATGKSIEQICTFRVFWRPIGGVTSLNNKSLNATYRYALITEDSVAMYEGAGFVRLYGENGDATLKARLMDGDLRLTQASVNFVDTLGRSRFEGTFKATYDDARALNLLMVAHRNFFAHSLVKTPAGAATQPGAPRDIDFPTLPESATFPGEASAPAGSAKEPATRP